VGVLTVLSRRAVVGGLAGLGVSVAGLVLSSVCTVVFPAAARLPRIGYLAQGPREAGEGEG
jgi:hypothetical protein